MASLAVLPKPTGKGPSKRSKAYVTIVGWEMGVGSLPDSRPAKQLLLELAYNKSEEVTFSGTPIKVEEMELIAAGLPTSRIREVFGEFLVSLDLSRCQLSYRSAEVLGAALVANDTLRKIWINSNPIGPAGCRALAVALCSNDTLMSINMSNCDITKGRANGRNKFDHIIYDVDLTGLEALSTMIATNKSLTRLNVAKNNLDTGGFEMLMPAVRVNKTLRSLSVAMNSRNTDAMLFVARCLKSTKTLAKIDLKSNTVALRGAQTLESALKQNRSLTHLNLRNTQLDLTSLQYVIGPLHVCSLLHVDLSYNHIGSAGCKLMCSALAKSSVTSLNLSNCFLTDKGANMSGVIALADAIGGNRSLAALDLSSNALVKTSFRSFDNREDNYTSVMALARAINENQVIIRVDLSANGIKKRGQLPFVEALEASPYGMRFATHIQTILENWYDARNELARAQGTRYDGATLSDTKRRMLRLVFDCLAEERQILF